MTALMRAIENNDTAAVRKLIEQGANVDELEPNGDAPLVMAAYLGHAEIVRLLLDAGADVKAVDPGMKATALHAAAYAGRTEAAKLLVAGGVEIDKRHANSTPTGCNLNRITASCLHVWDLLTEFFPTTRFECQVVNPPFGLPWLAPDFKLGRASSTAVTWKRVRHFAMEGGYGYFIAGRKQLETQEASWDRLVLAIAKVRQAT